MTEQRLDNTLSKFGRLDVTNKDQCAQVLALFVDDAVADFKESVPADAEVTQAALSQATLAAKECMDAFFRSHARQFAGTGEQKRKGESRRVQGQGPEQPAFGGEKLTASQIKNKKKKEKAVRDKEEAAAKEAEDAASKKAGKAAPAAAAAAGAGEKPIGDLTPEEKEKRIKKVTKQLRQIDQLKETQASGSTLESNQLEKLKGEEAIRAELKGLSL